MPGVLFGKHLLGFLSKGPNRCSSSFRDHGMFSVCSEGELNSLQVMVDEDADSGTGRWYGPLLKLLLSRWKFQPHQLGLDGVYA